MIRERRCKDCDNWLDNHCNARCPMWAEGVLGKVMDLNRNSDASLCEAWKARPTEKEKLCSPSSR